MTKQTRKYNYKNIKNLKHLKKTPNLKSKNKKFINKKHKRTIKKIKNSIKKEDGDLIVLNDTPRSINNISERIARGLSNGSYSPTVNKDLVTMVSLPKSELFYCNIDAAYELKEPLQISLPDKSGKKCYYYYTQEAKKFLLKNLASNKHVNPDTNVTPIQSQSNCWFNTMFVTFFISDKGRKFFHFLRQLMIEGQQQDGSKIPDKLRDIFALLNFGIEACLTGNEYAYKLNTNKIIHFLYENIPDIYKKKYPYIVDVDEAGNPLLYYNSIINYLNNKSLILLFIRDANVRWRETILENVTKQSHLPHIIVLEVSDENAYNFNTKPENFFINEGKYQIDSAVIRDTTRQHFCATLTCEGSEYGYDGLSFHRMVPLKWKNNVNKDMYWQFEGTNNFDGTPLKWNFTKSYQLLMYYRVV